jgi:hypothetical protein
VETAALWKPWKTNDVFPAPTGLGKLANRARVFHSSHSHYYEINKRKKAKPAVLFYSTVVALPN